MSLLDGPSPFAPRKPRAAKKIKANGHATAAGTDFGDDWRSHLITNAHGAPQALMANAATAFRWAPEWAGRLALNTFVGQVWDNQKERYWSMQDDLQAADWMQHHGIKISPAIVRQAVNLVGGERAFHPVKDYLASLQWDGIPRLDEWTTNFLRVSDTPYARAVGARWMISAVARVMKPGCKADCLLVLEGPQGAMKSTALKTLGDPWFTDELADIRSKDASMQVSGAWIIEIAELDSFKRSEVSYIKAFLSRREDRFRPPYGHAIENRKRESIFAATTNESEWGRDDTGLRRFWPLSCGRVDIDGLAENKDQLWAEARDRYMAGEVWYLDTADLVELAKIEQEERQAEDTWTTFIADFAANRFSVSIAECLSELGFQRREHDRASQMRVASALKSLGYKRYRERENGGTREWRYRKESQP